jgi:hypothetical protein
VISLPTVHNTSAMYGTQVYTVDVLCRVHEILTKYTRLALFIKQPNLKGHYMLSLEVLKRLHFKFSLSLTIGEQFEMKVRCGKQAITA